MTWVSLNARLHHYTPKSDRDYLQDRHISSRGSCPLLCAKTTTGHIGRNAFLFRPTKVGNGAHSGSIEDQQGPHLPMMSDVQGLKLGPSCYVTSCPKLIADFPIPSIDVVIISSVTNRRYTVSYANVKVKDAHQRQRWW